MIRGVGLDLCEIARMEKTLADERFLARYFTEAERDYILGRGRGAAQSLAGCYAAKEAVVKAMGCGIVFALTDIEIWHDEQGTPGVRLYGEARRRAPDGTWFLSITHEADMAAAVAVWETAG